MEGWMAGREAGCFQAMSFCEAKPQKLKNGMEAVFEPRKG
jgi:hypothetical protein